MANNSGNDSSNYSTLNNIKDKVTANATWGLGKITGDEEKVEAGNKQYYQAVGDAQRNEERKESERKAEEAKKESEQKVKEFKENPGVQALKGVGQQVVGAGQGLVGGLTGNKGMQNEGDQHLSEGKGRFEVNAKKAEEQIEKEKKEKAQKAQKEQQAE
ncbi:hypothetical protein LPJ63_002896 [Coemansia sp. RSA 2711]|nr:hypothetical protein LPJ63_002896 [Coemansia sp. RSA 2711]KAJ2307053.1 hypothetical protein IWW54_004525 [Coemansia sp. RSA 2705]KAJ2314613.1 hypothetical protein IWW52_004239 [Coemansia sp. RSA 2704]KAJ2382444.1 hypothetical protein H4S02_005742 [Coemansia sp. RSA 2611]